MATEIVIRSKDSHGRSRFERVSLDRVLSVLMQHYRAHRDATAYDGDSDIGGVWKLDGRWCWTLDDDYIKVVPWLDECGLGKRATTTPV